MVDKLLAVSTSIWIISWDLFKPFALRLVIVVFFLLGRQGCVLSRGCSQQFFHGPCTNGGKNKKIPHVVMVWKTVTQEYWISDLRIIVCPYRSQNEHFGLNLGDGMSQCIGFTSCGRRLLFGDSRLAACLTLW